MDANFVPEVLFAARSLCAAPWRWHNPSGFKDCANLWLIVGGQGTWMGEGQTYSCAPGDFFVQRLWNECEGRNQKSPPFDVLWANIGWRDGRGKAVDLRAHEAEVPMVHRRMGDLGFVSTLFRRLITSFERKDLPQANRWLACVLEMAAESDAGGKNTELQPLITAVRLEPELPWRVAELAHRAGMKTDVFARRFRSATGVSPREFLVQVRLDAAKAHLRMSDASISQIAERLGFCDIYHFSRRFRTHIGRSPTEYRAGMGS